MAGKISKQDLQWQAESDANTMMRYQEIINDKSRMNRAIREAEKQAKDLNRRANAMQSAAKMRVGNKMSGRKR
jgi:hypothetical protein